MTRAIAAKVHQVASTSVSITPARRATASAAITPLIEDEERGLRERGEVLGLPVPPRMPGVGRPHRDRDREEREQRGREVGPRVRSLGEQPEAPAREPRGELDRDQQARGPDRDQRGAPLR